MWNRIYLAFFAFAFFVMSFYTLYSRSWLGSIGDPKDAVAGYEYYASAGSIFLWISTFALLIFANILLWNSRRSWALWTSFGYFAFFILLQYFWLEVAAFNLQKSNQLTDSNYVFSPFAGFFYLIIVGVCIFINRFLNLHLNEKAYPPKEPENDPKRVEEV